MKQPSIRADVADAFRQNLIPAVCLQVLAISVGCLYYFIPSIQTLLKGLAAFKAETGILYAIISTSLFGGAIPFLYLYLTKQAREKPVHQCFFYLVVWAIIGAIVDVFYRFQEVWFGSEVTVATVIKKTCVDQFIFSALLTCPLITVAYIWKDQLFDATKTRKQLNARLFTRNIPTTVLTNWIVWIPAVCVIYTMPSPLQVPFFNLVLCFFVLLLAVLNRQAPSTTNPGDINPILDR